MNNQLDIFIRRQKDFLDFLKSRYSLFHLSNLFFRDVHYGVMAFLQMNNLPHHYTSSEDLTRRVIASYVESKILVPIDERSWMLNYLPFKKAATKPAAPLKPPVQPSKPTSPPVAATSGIS